MSKVAANRAPRPDRSLPAIWASRNSIQFSWEMSREWDHAAFCQLWIWTNTRLKQAADLRKHAIADRAANLEQKIGTSSRPSHLLRFVHTLPATMAM